MSLLNWRGWILGAFLGGLTTIHFLLTVLGLILIFLVPEHLAVSGYLVTRRQIWLWREDDLSIMIAALGCSLLIFYLR